MTAILALDTATDALSLALQRGDGSRQSLHRVMPRQQQQSLFRCLDELLQGSPLRSLGLSAIAYGQGPGSFTGLRIAVSAAQGLAYALSLPVVGIATLETQARTFVRRHQLREPCLIVSTIDARIGELYAASYHFEAGRLSCLQAARVCRPEALQLPELPGQALAVYGVGSGFSYFDTMDEGVRRSVSCFADILPEAEDMLSTAEALLCSGAGQAPALAAPQYLSERSGWKTLAEQGRKA